MKPAFRFLQHVHPLRITLFYRQNCMLCTIAKEVLSDVWDKRPFEFKEIDVMAPEGKQWKEFYEFDTPVIHVSDAKSSEDPSRVGKAQKLMHRFKIEQVMEKMDNIAKISKSS